jgi:hypothetical protein
MRGNGLPGRVGWAVVEQGANCGDRAGWAGTVDVGDGIDDWAIAVEVERAEVEHRSRKGGGKCNVANELVSACE